MKENEEKMKENEGKMKVYRRFLGKIEGLKVKVEG